MEEIEEKDIKLLEIVGTNVSIKDRFITDYDKLIWVTEFFKKEGKKIVFVGGTYDMFHVGHARYLQKAKEQGDILIVGVDSDKLTKRLKGESRPVVPFVERSETLIHNRSVNIVTELMSNDETDDLIRRMKPDVLVLSTSTNYVDEFVSKMQKKLGDHCGTIVVLDPQATTSTSARIRFLTIDGAHELSVKIEQVIEENKNSENLSVILKEVMDNHFGKTKES
ncbi:MAG: hypothetical protein QG594_1645 [Bacteroidota bacterium]|jgi:D-beta-D-heptose 7-phosphate kinase/D-beta-D-heptose 1-phosphate adenosyltransferase|nr:hypothetical protein [Bacteroidota bacterium]